MRGIAIAAVVALSLLLAGCAGAAGRPSSSGYESQSASQEIGAPASMQQTASQEMGSADNTHGNNEGETGEMRLSIGETDVDVAWEDNQAVADLRALAADGPIVVELHKYGGFEQVGPLGASLSADDVQMTTEPGDIVLYASNQISVFYGPNTWAYTLLGHITDRTAEELADLLGNDDVAMTITVDVAE